jgi:hypothetical protein
MRTIVSRRHRRIHTFALVTLLLAMMAASSVSPASAAPAKASVATCNSFAPAGADLFSGYDRLASSNTARGDVVREPELNAVYQTLPESAKGKAGKNFRATTPVYFHVISDGSVGNVTQKDIDTQITIMNLAAAGFYGGVKTGFSFRLAGVTRTDNAAWFNAGPGSPAEREMKKALTRGAPQALNYYSTTAGPYLGWAYLPGLNPSQLYLDGIVVDWESMYKTSTTYAGRFDLGFTAVHEWGHWVNLEHTFYRGCSAGGDYVDDTPAMKIPTSRCPVGKDTCTNDPGLDPIHNFMDYSDDPCYSEFTAGQAARAQDSYLFFRAS